MASLPFNFVTVGTSLVWPALGSSDSLAKPRC